MEAKEPLILIPAFTLCEGIQKKKRKEKGNIYSVPPSAAYSMYCVCEIEGVGVNRRVCLRTCRRENERARLSCRAALIIAFQCWINIQRSALGGRRVSINLCNLNTYNCVNGSPSYINRTIPRD